MVALLVLLVTDLGLITLQDVGTSLTMATAYYVEIRFSFGLALDYFNVHPTICLLIRFHSFLPRLT